MFYTASLFKFTKICDSFVLYVNSRLETRTISVLAEIETTAVDCAVDCAAVIFSKYSMNNSFSLSRKDFIEFSKAWMRSGILHTI